MKQLTACLLIALLTACGSVHSSKKISAANTGEIHKLHLDITAADTIWVVNEQMDTTATAAVFFGLVGALAVSAYDNNVDGNAAQRLQNAMGGFDARSAFAKKLSSTLRTGGIDTAFGANSQNGLRVKLVSWGVRRNSRSSHYVVPYVEMDIEMQNAQGKIVWQKRDVQVGNAEQSLSYYESSPAYLKKQLTLTLQEAAEYVANQIIYR